MCRSSSRFFRGPPARLMPPSLSCARPHVSARDRANSAFSDDFRRSLCKFRDFVTNSNAQGVSWERETPEDNAWEAEWELWCSDRKSAALLLLEGSAGIKVDWFRYVRYSTSVQTKPFTRGYLPTCSLLRSCFAPRRRHIQTNRTEAALGAGCRYCSDR